MGSLSVHPDGILLAAGDSSGQIRLRKIDCNGKFTEDSYQPWQAHTGNVHSMTWSSDGSRLYSAGDDGRVLSWSLAAAQRTGPRSFVLHRSVDFQLMQNRKQFLISDLAESRISLWDWASGKSIATSRQNNLRIAAASPAGTYFAAFNAANSLQIFAMPRNQSDSLDGQLLATWQPGGGLSCIRFSPDKETIAVSRGIQNEETTSVDYRIWLLKLPGLTAEECIPIDHARSSAFSPDGFRIAVVSQQGLFLWRIADRRIDWRIPQADSNLAEFSPNGNLIATDSLSRTVLIRNAVDGSTVSRLANHRAQILAIAFSPDSRLLATSAADGTVKIWHVELGLELIEFQMQGNVGRLGFSADGTHLICHLHPDSESSQDSIVVFDGSPFKL
jgi:WD40 repeat protein